MLLFSVGNGAMKHSAIRQWRNERSVATVQWCLYDVETGVRLRTFFLSLRGKQLYEMAVESLKDSHRVGTNFSENLCASLFN